jgi:hypothetical protein
VIVESVISKELESVVFTKETNVNLNSTEVATKIDRQPSFTNKMVVIEHIILLLVKSLTVEVIHLVGCNRPAAQKRFHDHQ